jgi:hypothetical protein
MADWLTPIDYSTQKSDFISRRQEGTGEWLLDSDKLLTSVDLDRDNEAYSLLSCVLSEVIARFRRWRVENALFRGVEVL